MEQNEFKQGQSTWGQWLLKQLLYFYILAEKTEKSNLGIFLSNSMKKKNQNLICTISVGNIKMLLHVIC